MNDEELMLLRGERQMSFKELMGRILKYILPETVSFIFAFLLIIINVVFSSIFPLLVEQLTNHLGADDYNLISLKYIFILAGSYLGLILVNQIVRYFESMILQRAGQRIIYKLRMQLFEHIESMSVTQLNNIPVGSLVTRVANYTTNLSDLFTNTLVNLLQNFLTVIIVFLIMCFKQSSLARGLVGIVSIVFLASFLFSRIVKRIYREDKALISELNAFLNENLSGMKLTQIFNQEQRKLHDFNIKNTKLRNMRFNRTIAYALYRPFISFLYYLSIAFIFIKGLEFKVSPGVIIAFYLYLSNFFKPIELIADQLNNIQFSLTASEKLFNLLDLKPEVNNVLNPIKINEFKGKIEFKHVWFAYNNEDWILKDVSFVVNPGETCAFVGATGAGKTTILSLIVRNFKIQKGQILIDDIDITKIDIESLRKNIGQMLQDVFLFSGDIKTNITLHDDDYTDEEVYKACQYVNADYFIDKLENGLHEKVIERGENFSQGQRQLLSFARTILPKPQILILDEATANIDTETEQIIQKSLENMKNIGTMLVVAHRLSTIQKSDKIVVLDKGIIAETGNHQDLLKKKGLYYKFYQLQLSGELNK